MLTGVQLGYHIRSSRAVGLRWRKDKSVMSTQRIANYGAAGGPIFDREGELSRIGQLLDGVSERGAALLVRGEPGIGKSTLLAAASQRAEAAGMRVLRTTGVHSEARLPFAGLHQLVFPVLGHAEHLPAPQRTALLAAFGMVEAEMTDRFFVAAADRAPGAGVRRPGRRPALGLSQAVAARGRRRRRRPGRDRRRGGGD